MKKLCPFCKAPREMTKTRGHVQCSDCKRILEDCCWGAEEVLPTKEVEAKDAWRKAEGLPARFLSWGHVNKLVGDAAEQALDAKHPT